VATLLPVPLWLVAPEVPLLWLAPVPLLPLLLLPPLAPLLLLPLLPPELSLDDDEEPPVVLLEHAIDIETPMAEMASKRKVRRMMVSLPFLVSFPPTRAERLERVKR
jgi:hypothetical protein